MKTSEKDKDISPSGWFILILIIVNLIIYKTDSDFGYLMFGGITLWIIIWKISLLFK